MQKYTYTIFSFQAAINFHISLKCITQQKQLLFVKQWLLYYSIELFALYT